MRTDLKILALIAGLAILASNGSAQTATESTAAAGGETTEASATPEKKATARHKRKAYLNAKRMERREARRQAAAQNPPVPVVSGPVADVAVSFKVDPRMTRSMYMGDRWFSTPTFTTVQDVDRVSVEVRAVGRDASGRRAPVAPAWVSADPKMVSVSPARGSDVTITVHRAGDSTLRLVQPLGHGDKVLVKEFAIRAWNNRGSAIQAEISQKGATVRDAPSGPDGTRQLGLSVPAADAPMVTAAGAEGDVRASAQR